MGRHRTYAIGASMALSVAISFEIARILVDRPWMGITPVASHAVSGAIATLCFAAAVILPARRESLAIDGVRWVLGVLSVLALGVHTAFTVWQHDPFAVVPFMCAVATGICIKRTFDRGELALGRPTDVAGPSVPPAPRGLGPAHVRRAIRSR